MALYIFCEIVPGVVVPPLLLGHQDDPEVGQDVRAQHLSVVYLSLLVFLRSECRDTQLCGWCQLVWRNSGNCDLMVRGLV